MTQYIVIPVTDDKYEAIQKTYQAFLAAHRCTNAGIKAQLRAEYQRAADNMEKVWGEDPDLELMGHIFYAVYVYSQSQSALAEDKP